MTKNNDEYHQIEFNIAKDDLAETEKILELYQPLSISIQGFGEEKIYEPLPGEMPIWEKIRVKAMYQNIKNLSDLENEIINKTNIKILNNKVIKAIGKKDWQEEWIQSSKPMRFGEKLWIYPDHLIDNLEGKEIKISFNEIFKGSNTTLTTSAWPVLPEQTSSYDGLIEVPPAYPTEVSVTPCKFQSRLSTPQKHPAPRIISLWPSGVGESKSKLKIE